MGMPRAIALLALLLAACAGSADTGSADDAAIEAVEESAPACDIDPQIADAAALAIQLWADAAGTAIPLPSRIELADFGDDTTHAAAWNETADVLQISTRTAPEKRASSIAHELGHSLGLEHDFDTGDLMDPDRSAAARIHPCITAELVAAAGYSGPGACARE